MRVAPQRDLAFSARPTQDNARVLISIGAYRFTSTRSEAVELARLLVTAVDALALAPLNGDTDD